MSSPKFVGELSGDSKTRGKFNETLMGLLLQLDTIQVKKQPKHLAYFFPNCVVLFAIVQMQLNRVSCYEATFKVSQILALNSVGIYIYIPGL
jgi:hypothetical protein